MNMKTQFIRGTLMSGCAATLLFAATAPASAGDNDPLLQLLRIKGVISSAELANVEGGSGDQRRERLVDLLRSKGILSSADAANLAGGTAAAPFSNLVRVATPQRPPVAHALRINDDGSEGRLYYASDDESDTSPLSFKLGGVSFYPGAVIHATTIFRSTNTGNIGATNFGAIPFKNTVQGNVSETHITGQGTTFDLKAMTDIGVAHVNGYVEMDFDGNDPSNVFVTANPHTARLRLAYADATWRGWELLFGQAYSMLTPNRTGMGDSVFLTNNADGNPSPGVTWTRAGQVRVIYHPSANWAFGVAAENPDQFVGSGETIYPFAFNAVLGPQFDAGNNPGTPNKFPDIIGKIAFDTNPGSGHNFHAELTGLLTTIRSTVVPTGGVTFEHETAIGGGVGAGFDWQVMPNFSVIANGFYSDGGGRYIGGLGPDTVIVPFVKGAGFSARPSLVHSAGISAGLEWTIRPGSELDFYYSGAYFGRNAFMDITSPLLIKPTIGFGGTNSPNSANRYIQQVSADFIQDIWADPSYGLVQVQGQLSYIQRNAWFVAAGAPVHADVVQSFVDVRLLIP